MGVEWGDEKHLRSWVRYSSQGWKTKAPSEKKRIASVGVEILVLKFMSVTMGEFKSNVQDLSRQQLLNWMVCDILFPLHSPIYQLKRMTVYVTTNN